MNRQISSKLAHLAPHSSASRWLIETAFLAAGSMTGRQRRRFLDALMEGPDFKAACAAAGSNMSQVVSQRLNDPIFCEEWRMADTGRLEAAETLLIDQLVKALQSEKLADKSTVQLWQSLRDDRRRPAEPVRDAASTPTTGPGAGVSPGAEDDQPRIDALIDEVERRMRAAEDELGLRA
ncbi:hypothetical protein [Sandaracinobacteroides hominis]|uniref:hypothetical protein n=1 Tax=Sandaracinobacteroides hominis TaxID=2780086 RepID=UPI0018F4FD5C|nr:hypothetical protein [Sandaracinobacteroides hominis]